MIYRSLIGNIVGAMLSLCLNIFTCFKELEGTPQGGFSLCLIIIFHAFWVYYGFKSVPEYSKIENENKALKQTQSQIPLYEHQPTTAIILKKK